MRGATDANQPAIVAALRSVGASVEDLSQVGAGVPDLLVGYRGRNYLIEVKTASGKLTKHQEKWHPLWRGQVAIARTPEEAWAIIGAEVS